MEVNCKNCELALKPDYEHCPKCGQKTKLHRLSLHDVIHDGIHFFFHADKSLFTLLRQLTINGGLVAREFVEGKRKKYFPPLNFFLLVATIYVFVQVQTDYPKIDVVKEYPLLQKIKDEATRIRMIEAYQRREDAIHFMNHHSNAIMMASLPIIALVFWLLYRRNKFNYTENMVAGMYMFGFFTLVFTLWNYIGILAGIDGRWIYASYWIGQIVYFAVFYKSFMKGSVVKSIFSSLLAVVILFLINFLGVAVYMFLQ